jgi:hypothetical protein
MGWSVPLTPALSLGERENSRQSVGESKRVRTASEWASPLPLPWGEGWGEGEAAGVIASHWPTLLSLPRG